MNRASETIGQHPSYQRMSKGVPKEGDRKKHEEMAPNFTKVKKLIKLQGR